MKLLFRAEEIAAAVKVLANQLEQDYAQKPLTILGVMSGGFMFLADLIRCLKLPVRVGVIQARSYRGTATTGGDLVSHWDFLPELRGRHVLLVDDIFDTGKTLNALASQLNTMDVASLESAVLLRKAGTGQVQYSPKYVLFEIPDLFVVGYGLDYQDAYRNLDYVAALEPHEIGVLLD